MKCKTFERVGLRVSTCVFVVDSEALIAARKISTLLIDLVDWFAFADSKVGAKIREAVAPIETKFPEQGDLLQVHHHQLQHFELPKLKTLFQGHWCAIVHQALFHPLLIF